MPVIRNNKAKKLMKFRKKSKTNDFGPKNPLHPILGKIRIFKKKSKVIF